jgi:Fic family protein
LPAQAAEQIDPLVKNVRELLDRPIPPDTKKELEKQWKALDKAAAELRKALANADPALVKQAEAEVDDIRASASGTVRGKHGVAVGGGNAAQLARANFQKASEMVRGWAAARTPISIDGLQKINEVLGAGLDNNGGTPGEVRKKEVMTTTSTGAPNPYLPTKAVTGELAAAVAWYQANRAKLKGPDLAAKMYQRLVSIHPFMDANGRTCRLAMDWVLQSHGLPPAAMQGDDEINVAVFALDKIAGRPSVAPGQAEQAVVAGIKRTIEVMKRVIQQAK